MTHHTTIVSNLLSTATSKFNTK